MQPSRFMVPVKGLLVQVRVLGSGPPVLLLHGSPQSSAAMIPMMEAVARAGGTAIAPDTPGNGLSQGNPRFFGAMTFGHALAHLINALRLGPVPVYGFHTGAVIAAELGLANPKLVTSLVLDGVPAWNRTERDLIHNRYLTWFEPVWTGEHMAWTWARFEDQGWFFPWFHHKPGAWMAHGVMATSRIHANVMDFLADPNASNGPYQAAFSWAPNRLPELTVPTRITAAPADPLHPHLARLPRGTNLHLVETPDDPDTRRETMADWLVREARGALRNPAPLQTGALRFVDGPFGPALIRMPEGKPASARLLDWGRSARRADPEPDTVLIERPGHGASALPPPDLPWPDSTAYATALLAAAGLAHLPLEPDPAPACPPAPDMTARWDGSHLITAWRMARRSALFQDWTAPTHATRHRKGLDVDAEAIQVHAVDLLEAAEALRRATVRLV